MGDHNTEDARSSVPPRRGARPFVGPAGAPGQPLPLLRATTTRPAPRPFVPAPGTRPSLGTTPRPIPSAPVAPVAVPPASAAKAPAPVPAEEMPPGTDTLATAALALPEAPPAPIASVAPAATTPAWLAAQAAPQEMLPTAVVPPAAVDEPAPDRFAAFDVTWQDDPAMEPSAAPPTDASLLDVASLGSGHTDELWAADIVAEVPTAPPSEPAVPAWLVDEADPVPIVPVTAAATEAPAGDICSEEASVGSDVESSEVEPSVDASMLDASWADVTIMPSADAIMAAGLEVADTVVVEEPNAAWPDPLLAEYAPYVPTPTTVAPVNPFQAEAPAVGESVQGPPPMSPNDTTAADMVGVGFEPQSASPADSLVAHSTATPIEVEAEPVQSLEIATSHASLVAASLDRLAERVRDGQIDVSSVAPEGPDAAVLAAVLAALLGGGRSSSR